MQMMEEDLIFPGGGFKRLTPRAKSPVDIPKTPSTSTLGSPSTPKSPGSRLPSTSTSQQQITQSQTSSVHNPKMTRTRSRCPLGISPPSTNRTLRVLRDDNEDEDVPKPLLQPFANPSSRQTGGGGGGTRRPSTAPVTPSASRSSVYLPTPLWNDLPSNGGRSHTPEPPHSQPQVQQRAPAGAGQVNVTRSQKIFECQDPRDHTMLESLYNEMHASRFINLTPVSLLTSHLSLHLERTVAYPPLVLGMPPRGGAALTGMLRIGPEAGSDGLVDEVSRQTTVATSTPDPASGTTETIAGGVREEYIGGLSREDEGEYKKYVAIDRSRMPDEKGYASAPAGLSRHFSFDFGRLGMNLSVGAIDGWVLPGAHSRWMASASCSRPDM